MFSPSTPLGSLWKTLQTIFRRILLVMPRPHAKYSRTIHPNIPGSFIYSGLFTYHLLNNYCTWSGITLFTYFTEVIIIWICSARLVPDYYLPPSFPSCLDVYELHMAITYQFYNRFKVTNIRIVRNLFQRVTYTEKLQPMVVKKMTSS